MKQTLERLVNFFDDSLYRDYLIGFCFFLHACFMLTSIILRKSATLPAFFFLASVLSVFFIAFFSQSTQSFIRHYFIAISPIPGVFLFLLLLLLGIVIYKGGSPQLTNLFTIFRSILLVYLILFAVHIPFLGLGFAARFFILAWVRR